MRARLAATGICLILTAGGLVGACSTPAMREDVRHESATAPAEGVLEMVYRFTVAGPEERALMYSRAEIDFEYEPSPINGLRLGLLTALPNHPGTNPDEAGQLISSALDQQHDWPANDVRLARIHLEFAAHQKAAERRIQELENALQDARDKIDSLTSIEQIVEPEVVEKPDAEQQNEQR